MIDSGEYQFIEACLRGEDIFDEPIELAEARKEFPLDYSTFPDSLFVKWVGHGEINGREIYSASEDILPEKSKDIKKSKETLFD